MKYVKNARRKAGREKIKAVQNAEKQGNHQPYMGTKTVFCGFSHIQDLIQKQKGQDQNECGTRPVPGAQKSGPGRGKPVKEMADNSQT